MPPLDKKFFTGDNDIEPEECARLEIRNLSSDVEDCLKEFGWKGETAACVSLLLSADNTKVEGGQFIMVGPLSDYKEEAARIWPSCKEGVMLLIRCKSAANVFSFSNGGLTSDIVSQERLEYAFYAQKEAGAGTHTVILESEYDEYGIGDFCVRTVCSISKNSTVKDGVMLKYSMLLFPASRSCSTNSKEPKSRHGQDCWPWRENAPYW
jgi:hypothetical protein